MIIRSAAPEDIPQMTSLAEQQRRDYEIFAPVFWRWAPDGVPRQAMYFERLLAQPNILAMVSEHNGGIDGFIIGCITPAPPVYDPGTQVCRIDDFCVVAPEKWKLTGRVLLEAVRASAAAQGAELSVVVCGHQDVTKGEMLRAAGFEIASSWYVSPL